MGSWRISIHVPRVGDDGYNTVNNIPTAEFLSTSPAWGTTRSDGSCQSNPYDISIHVPRVGDDTLQIGRQCEIVISIHVPRVGDDRHIADPGKSPLCISIHVPRVGDDGFPCMI